MTHTYFVTGTDTDVGKTAVACALLEAANQRGLQTAAVKPRAPFACRLIPVCVLWVSRSRSFSIGEAGEQVSSCV